MSDKPAPVTDREIIVYLWAIIDDIDTYSDMAKADDRLYRELVHRRLEDRWRTGITSDGYNLRMPNGQVLEDSGGKVHEPPPIAAAKGGALNRNRPAKGGALNRNRPARFNR